MKIYTILCLDDGGFVKLHCFWCFSEENKESFYYRRPVTFMSGLVFCSNVFFFILVCFTIYNGQLHTLLQLCYILLYFFIVIFKKNNFFALIFSSLFFAFIFIYFYGRVILSLLNL